jgi:2,3-diketo-5-methylthio-1-phosphopentane phosphatase
MNAPQPRVYLLDVEGTVAPISFVYERLFPYARTHISDFLRQNVDDPAVAADLMLLSEENQAETDAGVPRVPKIKLPLFQDGTEFRRDALDYLLWLMDRDRKSTALKSLQGKIWKAGFESGELKGALFADVPQAFARWASHAKVVIYSSGSVEAQRLLFRHSIYGDLTPRISGYFDTRTGPKAASASYAAIAAELGVDPCEVLFLSDVVRELDPAREAGCQTRLVVREVNAPSNASHMPTSRYQICESRLNAVEPLI